MISNRSDRSALSAQLRAARAGLRLSQESLAQAADLNVITVRRIEAGDANGSNSHQALTDTLIGKGASFARASKGDEEQISVCVMRDKLIDQMVLGDQMKMARAYLDINQEAFAQGAKIGVVTVRRIEGEQSSATPSTRPNTIKRIVGAFEELGINFIYEDLGDWEKVGIVHTRKQSDSG